MDILPTCHASMTGGDFFLLSPLSNFTQWVEYFFLTRHLLLNFSNKKTTSAIKPHSSGIQRRRFLF